ncbi:MAG: hypothetical protein ACE5EO_10840 [Candidatus Krumholzibacteriia bacterium]
MSKKVLFPLAIVAMATVLSSCSMMGGTMAKMMGKGDLMGAMVNMDKVMKDMTPSERAEHMKRKQMAMLDDGKRLFRDPGIGKNGQSCESCHPGGSTTGGEAQIPMRDYRIPIPTLVGASARFPKYKVPNDRVVTLAQMNNNCIRMFMDGKGLELNSREAIALSMYISSLSNGESVQIGQAN